MLVRGGFLRVLAPSGAVPILLLLLLKLLSTTIITITTTTLLVLQPVGAQITTTSGTPSDDAILACAAEIADCEADVTCVDCITTSSSTSTGADARACFEEAGIDEVTISTATCSHYLAGICCIEEISDSECLENGPFLAYWVCFMEAKGCAGTEITCDGNTAVDSSATDDGATDLGIPTGVPTSVPTVTVPLPTVTDGGTDDAVPTDDSMPTTVPTPVPTATDRGIDDSTTDDGGATDDGATDGGDTDGGTDDGISDGDDGAADGSATDGGTDDGVSDGDDGTTDGGDVEDAGEASNGATTATTTAADGVGLVSVAFTLSCSFMVVLPLFWA